MYKNYTSMCLGRDTQLRKGKTTNGFMSNQWLLGMVLLVGMLFTGFTASAQVTVTGAVTGNGSYTILGAAITAIGTSQAAANINIAISGNTTEGTGTISIGAGTWATMTIQPTGVSWTITAATTAGSPMVDFNGADNVTINGLNSGGNALTISNTTVSATSGTSTIRFQTDATNNTITNCSVLGSSTMAVGTNGGNIWFGSGAVTTGNDGNTVSNCNIGPVGANLPTKGFYFSSKSTTASNQVSLSVNEARIVGSPAFLDNSTGQLVTSATAGDVSLSNSQFSLPGMSKLSVFNLAFLQVITCSQLANNDPCRYEIAGSFANNIMLAIIDKSIAIMLKSSSYTCFENYGSSERFQA